jgi:formylglycine-generating enzyme
MTRSALLVVLVAAGCNVAGDEPVVESRASTTEAASAADIAPPLPSPPASSVAVSSGAPASASASSSALVNPDEPPPPCPDGMALVGRFCVDKFEASLEVIGADGIHSPHPHYERPEKGPTYYAVSKPGLFPQGYISRVESKAACEAAGKRLCRRSEWQRACRGEGWMRYPYANKSVRGKCSSGKLHLLREKFGDNPKGGWKYDEHFNSPDLNREPGYLARSGEYDGCVSDLGVFDMVGNLHEWVSDTVDQEFMDKLDSEDVERNYQPWHSGNGVFMGGFYSTTGEHGPGCLFTTVAHEPTYHDYSTGFRCCKAADLPKPEKKASGKKPREKNAAEKKTAEEQ